MKGSQIIYVRSFVYAEFAGELVRIWILCDFQKWALDTKKARLRDASLCVAGKSSHQTT